ncbi:POU domain, class 6, transcription factor 2 [Microtus ochrogaster]|uniref:POU domain, class 6, transcription factor 2 n=1 Tax=Microtus ochrogaster TaxID=79684 RepID=A0A8J6KPS8_MICOH|nr:POU domain, class 6, transcription factor 2 [Microtus ochrogaster]
MLSRNPRSSSHLLPGASSVTVLQVNPALNHFHSPESMTFLPLLTAQQLASAVAGVMPGGPPALNQPILIPFNMAGQLGGQQGLVLTLPTANLTNIQGLVAAAAAGGIMTLPLQNLQGNIMPRCCAVLHSFFSEMDRKSP